MTNFFNLYEFMKMLAYFGQFWKDHQRLRALHTLEFTFGCRLYEGTDRDQRAGFDANRQQADAEDGDFVFGTGGKVLEALQSLMQTLTGRASTHLTTGN